MQFTFSQSMASFLMTNKIHFKILLMTSLIFGSIFIQLKEWQTIWIFLLPVTFFIFFESTSVYTYTLNKAGNIWAVLVRDTSCIIVLRVAKAAAKL